MHSFVPVSLVATATLFSAVQGIEILKPATGDTVDATQGFDVVWTYDSSDFTNWEIELANPTPGKLVATDVTQASISGSATSTFSYHVAAFTGVADGTNYHVVLDPRNGASSTSASTSTGSTTSVTGIPTSATVVPPISVSTGGSNSTITTSSTSFSTFISGSVTSLIPQSTIIKTTVVPGGSATSTGTGKATSSPTIALAAGGGAVSSVGLLGSVVGAILGVFML
ncbi:hypothetical protein ZTR_09985 [Talaromyces verruculosus]|nr:hypothetical protein ZTR_09985 [Talaromyces verruculosus]